MAQRENVAQRRTSRIREIITSRCAYTTGGMLENRNGFREELQEWFAAWKTAVPWKVEEAQPLFLMLARAKL